jgi:hypothetical protein
MLGGLAWQVTLAEFMEQCAKVDKTTTSDGYSPLLEDYSNTKFFVFGSFSSSSSSSSSLLHHKRLVTTWLVFFHQEERRSYNLELNHQLHLVLDTSPLSSGG